MRYGFTLHADNLINIQNSDIEVGNLDNFGTGCIQQDPLFVDVSGDDFHLQSIVGSYHDGAWTADASHSPCIDAGNPSDSYSNEPEPNGDRINMGAYGNTDQASKSPLVTSCNSAGDEINQFAPGEKAYVKAVGLAASTSYKIWIQNYTVTEGATLQTNKDESGAQELVTTAANGSFGYGVGANSTPVLIWNISATAAVTHHEHDIVVDKQSDGDNTGKYNAASDGLDSASVAGIVAPVPDVSSLVLFASGLVLISLYFVYGRRRKGNRE